MAGFAQDRPPPEISIFSTGYIKFQSKTLMSLLYKSKCHKRSADCKAAPLPGQLAREIWPLLGSTEDLLAVSEA
jgi:hypothetical protein